MKCKNCNFETEKNICPLCGGKCVEVLENTNDTTINDTNINKNINTENNVNNHSNANLQNAEVITENAEKESVIAKIKKIAKQEFMFTFLKSFVCTVIVLGVLISTVSYAINKKNIRDIIKANNNIQYINNERNYYIANEFAQTSFGTINMQPASYHADLFLENFINNSGGTAIDTEFYEPESDRTRYISFEVTNKSNKLVKINPKNFSFKTTTLEGEKLLKTTTHIQENVLEIEPYSANTIIFKINIPDDCYDVTVEYSYKTGNSENNYITFYQIVGYGENYQKFALLNETLQTSFGYISLDGFKVETTENKMKKYEILFTIENISSKPIKITDYDIGISTFDETSEIWFNFTGTNPETFYQINSGENKSLTFTYLIDEQENSEKYNIDYTIIQFAPFSQEEKHSNFIFSTEKDANEDIMSILQQYSLIADDEDMYNDDTIEDLISYVEETDFESDYNY